MRIHLAFAVAIASVGAATQADAQTCYGTAQAGECAPLAQTASNIISTDTFWTTGTANPAAGVFKCPIVLNEPIFVQSGASPKATLTIQAGCIVRGQPRQSAVVNGSNVGSPGTLVVTRTGKLEAVGTGDQPIILTTAAIDADSDGVADVTGSFKTPWDGTQRFLDENPQSYPLSPLNAAGGQNTALWGGLVLLGSAPTNLGNRQGIGHGQGLIEGLQQSGYTAAQAGFGGVDPHDGSGRLRYVSVRHAGDEIGASNELNGVTLGGVGDGTELSYVEVYANFDDGFEWFGGTVDGDHLMVSYVGDDMFDMDQGYTGTNQFLFGIQGAFNENGGALFGTVSGDKGTEWDGDDYRYSTSTALGINVDLSTRYQQPGTTSPGPALENTPWPLSGVNVYNMTLIGARGAATDGLANPAVSPVTTGTKRGVQMRNGFAGRLYNSIVVNTSTDGLDVTNGDGSLYQTESNLGNIAVLSSTFVDSGSFGSPETTVIASGNAQTPPAGDNCNLTDGANPPSEGLTNEDTLLLPTGATVAGVPGRLDPSLLASGPIDPNPTGSCTSDGVAPAQRGFDANATYRGAFEPFAEKWYSGWTALGNPTAPLLTQF